MSTKATEQSQENSLSENKNKVVTRKNILDFRKYTQQIWLAGLGAFSRAEEEGSKLFEALVKLGEELEVKSTDFADQTVEKFSDKAKESVETVREHKDRVEKRFDQSVQQSFNKLGLVTHKDIEHLEHLIVQLHQKVDQLTQQTSAVEEKIKNKTTL